VKSRILPMVNSISVSYKTTLFATTA